MDSNTNFHPSLQLRALLRLRKDGEEKFNEARYYINICGDKRPGGGASDYEFQHTNDGCNIIIHRINHIIKDENRLY